MKKNIVFVLIFLLLSISIKAAPVKIFTYAYNRPEFVEWQYHTFKKFMQDDYVFIVFNDARESHHMHEINSICKKHGIECIRIPQEIHERPYLHRHPGEQRHHASVRTANVIQYSLDILGFDHDGLVVVIDSDMFSIKEFSVKKFMESCDIAAVPQSRNNGISYVNYLWNGLVFINMNTLPNKRSLNWNCGRVKGLAVDTGGYTYYYLQENPDAKTKYLSLTHSFGLLCAECKEKEHYICSHNLHLLKEKRIDDPTIDLLQSGPTNIEFLCNYSFLHYRGAGWDRKTPEYHRKKTELIKLHLEKIIGYSF